MVGVFKYCSKSKAQRHVYKYLISMNVHDRLHSIMTSVILCYSVYKCCRCPRVSPASQKSCLSLSWPCWAGLAGLGWAGLGWAGSELSLASQCPAQAQPRWRQCQCHGAARSREQLCCQSYLDIT